MAASFLSAASTRTADACGSNALLFNWSACVAFACCELATPKTLDEAAAIIKRARHRLRVVGTAHSFSRVADTDGVLLSLRGMPNAVHVLRDERTGTATARCSAATDSPSSRRRRASCAAMVRVAWRKVWRSSSLPAGTKDSAPL